MPLFTKQFLTAHGNSPLTNTIFNTLSSRILVKICNLDSNSFPKHLPWQGIPLNFFAVDASRISWNLNRPIDYSCAILFKPISIPIAPNREFQSAIRCFCRKVNKPRIRSLQPTMWTMVKQLASWCLDLKVADLDPCTAGQLPHLAVICWPWPPFTKNDTHFSFTNKRSKKYKTR